MLYKQKIFKFFLLFSLPALFIGTGLFAFLLYGTRQSDNLQNIQARLYAESDMLNLSEIFVQSNLDTLAQSEAVALWRNASDDPHYYFHAIQVQQELKKAVTNFDDMVLDIALTSTSDTHFIITTNTTQSKDAFFKTEYQNLPENIWECAVSHMEKAGTPYLCADLTKDNNLSKIVCFFPDFSMNSNLVYILTLSPKNLMSSNTPLPYCIVPNDETLPIIYSTTTEKQAHVLQEAVPTLRAALGSTAIEKRFSVQQGTYNLLCINSAFFPFSFVYLESYSWFSKENLAWIALFPIASFFLFVLPFTFLYSKALYQPISSVMSDLIEPAERETNPKQKIDEFRLIKANTTQTSLLNQALDDLKREKAHLKKEPYYRTLLFQIPNCDCPLSAHEMELSYYVILLEYHLKPNTENYKEIEFLFQKTLVKELLEQCTPQCEVFHHIYIDEQMDALIFDADALAVVSAQLEAITTSPDIGINLFIACSEAQNSVIHIHHAYEESRVLMEYRYILPQNTILTKANIENQPDDYYYFPLTIENQFITTLASGNKNALLIYDRIIRQNNAGKNFSNTTRKNFVNAVMHAITRVFQELKCTPQELLGKPFDPQLLALNFKQANIWSQMRLCISEILDALNQTAQSENNQQFIMQDFIATHYAEDIMLNDLAAYCHLAPTYCSSLFKQHFDGVTFKAYLNQYRIKVACNLLISHPNIKTSELTTLVGFNSANSFIRAFSKEMGCTPKAYASSRMK